MLSLTFKEKLTHKENVKLITVLSKYVLEEHFGGGDFFLRVFVHTQHDADDITQALQEDGLKFVAEIVEDRLIFCENFPEDVLDYEASSTSFEPTVSESPPPPVPVETKLFLQHPNALPSPIEEPNNNNNNHILKELQQLSEKFSNEIISLKNDLRTQIPQVQPVIFPSGSFSKDQPIAHQISQAINQQSSNPRFAAKNELLANGVRCDLCKRTLKGPEVMNNFLDVLRIHALEHFNTNHPSFKRFGCQKCPNLLTNFVKDIETHIKKHDSFTSLPEKRAQLVIQYMTPDYLRDLAITTNSCFPDIFEVTPKDISQVSRCAPPQKALRDPFPELARDFCRSHNISESRAVSRGAPIINL